MTHPPLPESITVFEGADPEDLWDRFRFFEALHHLHEICNPMSSQDLDAVVAALDPADGERAIDVACGHGELVLRLAERAAVEVVGIDASPWVLTRAVERAARRRLAGGVDWWLGDGAWLPPGAQWDLATCLGAPWVWHGFGGTVRALAARIRRGGRLAVGDLRLRRGADPGGLEGAPLTRSRQEAILANNDLEPLTEIVGDDAAAQDYQRLISESAAAYARIHSDADFRREAEEGRRRFEHDHAVLAWTVWVARKP